MNRFNAIASASLMLVAGCASAPPSPGELGIEPLAQVRVFFDA